MAGLLVHVVVSVVAVALVLLTLPLVMELLVSIDGGACVAGAKGRRG